MAIVENIGGLQEKRRMALLAYAIGQIRKDGVQKYRFVRSPEDLLELLRLDPLDGYGVQSSWVAEAVSCLQQYIHAAYHKLEPGFETVDFDRKDLEAWKLSGNYPDWAAVKMIETYPENVVHPSVRIGKTSLFKSLENDLNQSRLTTDSVRAALQNYLEAFAKICDLDVVSACMDGGLPERTVYYFIGRTRSTPCQYFWRKADVELGLTEKAMNPAAWSEWLAVDIPSDVQVLDLRPVVWNGQLCLVWAVWRDRLENKDEFLPDKLDVYLAIKRQNDQWSPPTTLLTREYAAKTSPVGARLIATVWTDDSNPKGKLGVLLTNDKTGAGALKEASVRDVFLRTLPHDDGAWLEQAAEYRFKSADRVQHPLMNQPGVVASDKTAGTLTPYLGLHATAYRDGTKDVLVVQGFCWVTPLPGANVSLTLTLLNRVPADDPPDLVASYSPAGGWNTVSLVYSRAQGSWTQPVVFEFGGGTSGVKKFEVRVTNLTAFPLPALLKNTRDAAQFLSLNQTQLALKFTRLNTLFGPELVQRASVSVDALLDWFTQFLQEPAPSTTAFDEPNGAFDSANGRNFWELFFHLPHLVASRLRDEERFQEAIDWLACLFDPQAPADPATPPVDNPRPLYWRCRPLMSEGNPGHEALFPGDPDAISYGAPVHYRILVFCEYVQTLIAKGDWYYRQLTRDSLVAAKLCYVEAQFLMGKAPVVSAVNRWQTKTVGELMTISQSRPGLEAFEKALAFDLGDFPSATDADARPGLLGADIFLTPINDQLLRLFALPGERMDNLRNNRSIDGTPLMIELFSPPTDPRQLVRDLAAGNSGAPRPMGGQVKVIAFRWRVSFEVALRASQLLSEFGSQVLNLLERGDQAELQETQQEQLRELGEFARTLQEQTLEQLRQQVTALEYSKAVVQERAAAYTRLYDENVSAAEYQVMNKIQNSKTLSLVASSLKPVGAAIAAVPNVFGLANGGHRIDKITDAVVFGLNIAASVAQMEADKEATTEAYRRRRQDWGIQRDQARAEIRALDAQIEAQGQAVRAAQTNLEQTLRANSHALIVHNFLKKRATNAELYRWMLGQLKALYYQAHDAVVSLCRSAQASMIAETGDYDASIPLPQVWQDSRHGLTAGEHLRVWLLRMEHDYMQRYQRRLELRKTVSLRGLFEDKVEPQSGIASWAEALKQLQAKGTLDFCLSQLLFDRDHPGHYCRLINTVAVNLPVVKGPYQDVRATLTQINSKIATRPTAQSVEYLLNPEGAVAPPDVQINLLAGQSIILSTGVADNGLTAQKPDEGLLNPFENTGAISCWQLKFPWALKAPQVEVLDSLTDIILEISFTARAGEPTFLRRVEDLVTMAEDSARNKKTKGAGKHG